MVMIPLGAILGGASLFGKLFGGAGKGAADARERQNEFQQRENFLKGNIYGTQQGAATSQYGTEQAALVNLVQQLEKAKLDRAQLGITAPQARGKQAMLGSLLANLQPARVQAPGRIAPHMGSITGGLSPSALSGTARQAGSVLERQALEAMLSKSDIPAMTDFKGEGLAAKPGILPAPQMADYKQAGKFESLASILGLIGGIAGLGKDLKGTGNVPRTPPFVPPMGAG